MQIMSISMDFANKLINKVKEKAIYHRNVSLVLHTLLAIRIGKQSSFAGGLKEQRNEKKITWNKPRKRKHVIPSQEKTQKLYKKFGSTTLVLMEMCVILFKMWKCVFKHTYQTWPYSFWGDKI